MAQHLVSAGGLDERPPVFSQLASLRAETASLRFNNEQLAARVRYLEKLIDTRDTVWWKRLWFRIDGWPPWYRVGPRAARWWH